MKTLAGIMIFAFLSIFALDNASYAQDSKQTETKTPQVNRGPNFVDADNDGICDNQKGRKGKGKGNGKGKGASFVDKDNDGVCDNYKNRAANRGKFIDKDGDGVCDNSKDRKGKGKGKGNGKGRGNCGGRGGANSNN